MEDADESMLVAAEALVLCSQSPLDRSSPETSDDLWSPDRPQSAANLEKMPSTYLPPWGIRSKRSFCRCILKAEVGEDSSAAVAGSQPSPATPLDFATASVPSTSGSEDAPSSFEIQPAKRRLSGEPSVLRGGVVKKVGAAERSSSVPVAIPALKPIRRQGKKKTTAELKAQEMALVDENMMLEKMVESKRKEMEALIAENVRLKSEKASLQHSRVAEEASRARFLLPDLNEPLTEA